MEYKKKLLLVTILSLAGVVTGLLLIYSPLWDWCEKSSNCDASILDEVVAQPLVLFSFSVFLVSALLYFLREEIFRSWLRFAKWYLPLAGIAILLSRRSHGGWGYPNIFATEIVAMWTAGLFFLISLILIIYKSLKLRRQTKSDLTQ